MKLALAIIICIGFLKECSTIKLSGRRVLGGVPVDIKNYPYQLCIVLKKSEGAAVTEFKGGAVIVSLYWAITAAQCIKYISTTLFADEMVYLRGNTSYWKNSKYHVDHKVVQTHVHSQFNSESNDYDIALLKVRTPFKGRYEKPIKVAGHNYELPIDAKVSVTGWGKINIAHTYRQDRLRAVVLQFVDNEDCEDVYAQGVDAKITKRMICAWESGKDACVDDAGGPMVYKHILIGVVSWGVSCASPIYPGVYSKVSAYYSWIRSYEQEQHTSLGISFRNARSKYVVKHTLKTENMHLFNLSSIVNNNHLLKKKINLMQ